MRADYPVAFGQSAIMWGRIDRGDEMVTVTLAGEFDIAARAAFTTTMNEIEATSPRGIVVNVQELSFMDSTGIDGLLKAHARAEGAHRSLSSTDLDPLTGRCSSSVSMACSGWSTAHPSCRSGDDAFPRNAGRVLRVYCIPVPLGGAQMRVHDDEAGPQPAKGKELTPAEFTRQMPDDEDGAGPGAPETVEPVQGGPGDGSTRPDRPPRRESDEDPSQAARPESP